jgi:hypothetical protein
MRTEAVHVFAVQEAIGGRDEASGRFRNGPGYPSDNVCGFHALADNEDTCTYIRLLLEPSTILTLRSCQLRSCRSCPF